MPRQKKPAVATPITNEQSNSPALMRVRVRRQGERMTAKERLAAQEAFLASYAKGHSITKSCEAARINRDTLYAWKEHDEPFFLRFNQAKEQGDDCVRDEIRRRGIEGWDEEVYQLKEYVGTVRKYSDRMLEMMAKARMPAEYRERASMEVTGKDGGAIETRHEQVLKLDLRSMTTEQLMALSAALGEADLNKTP